MALMYIKHGYETLVNMKFILLEVTALTHLKAEAAPRLQNKNTGGDRDTSIFHSHALNLREDTKINFQMTYSSLEL